MIVGAPGQSCRYISSKTNFSCGWTQLNQTSVAIYQYLFTMAVWGLKFP